MLKQKNAFKNTVGSSNICHTFLCLPLFGSFCAHIQSCFYMLKFSVYWIIQIYKSLIFFKLAHLMFSACLHHVVFRVIASFLRDVGSFVRVICHFVSCWDLGLFVCAFLLIIMGCSLLLSYFLFIVLILALGSSLTSQGCLRCGNQGKLCFLGVWRHLLTFRKAS